MTQAELKNLVDFNYWGRDRMLTAVGDHHPGMEPAGTDLITFYRERTIGA